MRKPITVDLGAGVTATLHGLGFWTRLYERARARRIRRVLR